MLRYRNFLLLLVLTAPVTAGAQCVCGIGDGLFTLTTIGIDGDMADWGPVQADPDNNVCDGPAGGLTDRDSPQSTGRDLTHLAYTWDTTYIYLFTERTGSPNNSQSFVYYADTDNDGLMETNEPVIGVSWSGNNQQVNVYLFTYVAAAPGGDPMVDGSGFGDGYTLPGSFANVPPTGSPDYSGQWGSGTQMEFAIEWADLGLAPNSPFSFHVSSSNAALGANSFTSQIDDNLSGCGGGLGTTVIPGVTMTPDRSIAGFAGDLATGLHTLTNTGNAADSYELTSSVAGDFTPTISYYEDTDGSATLTAGDTLLTDTDSDGDPDTGPISAAASITILIAYGVPAGAAPGESTAIATTATSNFSPLISDAVADTVNVVAAPDLLVIKSVSTISDPINLGVNPKAIPGSVILYTITVSNQGSGTVDTDSFEITDAVPGGGCMVVTDISGAGSGPVNFQDGSPSSNLSYSFVSLGSTTDDLEFSNDAGLTYNYTPTAGAGGCDPAVTDIRINPKGVFAADAGAGSPDVAFSFQVIVN